MLCVCVLMFIIGMYVTSSLEGTQYWSQHGNVWIFKLFSLLLLLLLLYNNNNNKQTGVVVVLFIIDILIIAIFATVTIVDNFEILKLYAFV